MEEFRQGSASWNALQVVISVGVTLAAQVGVREGIGPECLQQVAALPSNSITIGQSS